MADYNKFIDDALQAGYTYKEIEAELVKGGWKPRDIADIMGAHSYPRYLGEKYLGTPSNNNNNRPTPSDPRAPGPDPGFGGELYGQNVAPLVDLAKGAYEDVSTTVGQHPLTAYPRLLGHAAGAAVKGGIGTIHGQLDEVKKAWQAITGQGEYTGQNLPERGMEAIGRLGAAALPGMGPQAARAGEQFGQGHIGAGSADVLSLLGQLYLPKVVSKMFSPVNTAGRAAYMENLGVRPEQMNPPASAIESMAHRPDVRGAGDIQQKLNLLGNRTGDITDLVDQIEGSNRYSGQMVRTRDIVAPLQRSIAEANTAGFASDPKTGAYHSVLDDLVGAVGAQTNVPGARDLLRETWGRLSDKDFQASEAGRTGRVDAYKTRGQGLKQALENASYQVDPNSPVPALQDEAHTAMTLQHHLESIPDRSKSLLMKYLPYIGGFATIGAADAAGLGASHHLGTVGASSALIALMVQQAMKSPATMERLTMALSHIGEGKVAGTLANLPRVARGAALASPGIQQTEDVQR